MNSNILRLVVLTAWFVSASAALAASPADPQGVEFFEKNVRPVLVSKCQSCHGPKRQQGGLRLDSRAALLKGSDNGTVIVPGQPDKSLLVKAIHYQGDVQMPPKGKLPDEAVAHLTTWVKMGAPWPGDEIKVDPHAFSVAEVRRSHWAFQPVKKPPLPAVKKSDWVKTPVDAFVLAKLDAKGLVPSPAADRRTLIRRVTLDLHGLPPTPEEVTAFESDRSADAYEKLVDRLLASPRYGERWGRHWLDVARYADSKGYVFTDERRYPFAYTYRDYVIRSFNEDLPYDQFVVQQLAADRLPLGEDKRPLAALGYLTLGRRFLNNTHDIIDDRIDVTMRGLQAMTVGCARCHDHKFDPIPQKDYYSLYGVFASSIEPKELPLIGRPEQTAALTAFEKELTKRKAEVEKYRSEHKDELAKGNRKFRDGLRALRKKVEEWQATAPAAPPRAMVLEDKPAPETPHIFLRGNPRNPGPSVPRQFLEVVAGEKRQPFREGSGRLEMARAIADRNNPLTARVMVNRIWLHHFGAGLVRTPSDFGLRGEPPTHPELLDWLAVAFMDNGWSVKQIHRLLVLSNTYRQATSDDPVLLRMDPDNRLLARMNRQRLDFEAMRDSLLAVAGRLDATMGGRAVELTTAPFTTRRTVYGFIDRQNLPGLFRTFDFASPDTSTPQRYATTVPQQALFLMNSPFAIEQARHFVQRPDVQSQPKDEAKINRMYQLAFGRTAEADEIALGLRYLSEARKNEGEKKDGVHLPAWERYAQVLLLSNEFAFVD
ncbi:MAG TPA: PSD1 and planctomycete cytochrome C domain-containing protein [Gemmataceae bacterium]|jgi:mono/diheme cytochrome c family protein